MNLHEAKTHLSRLVDRAAAGEEVVIARAGKPVAKLVPAQEAKDEPREPGLLRGKIWLADDWDSEEINDQVARLFDDGEIFPEEEGG